MLLEREESDDVHQGRIRRILDKLEEARRRKLSCFGSDSHHFRLGRPISEDEVGAFEIAHGVSLPDGYRAFLLHAGHGSAERGGSRVMGGAGPYYGLIGLEEWDGFASFFFDDDRVPEDFLARPCMLHPGVNEGLEPAKAFEGTLTLGTQGCSYFMQLIVSGPCRGRVVYADADGLNSPYVVRDPDFLSWYERWLDELIGGYETSWFGYGPAGGETELFAVLHDPHSGEQLRNEAKANLRRLPRLSAQGAAQVLTWLDQPSPDVRTDACATVGRFAIQDGERRVSELLGDTDPGVRTAAIRALMKTAPNRWADTIRAMLRSETDPDAVGAAFYTLKNAGKHSRVDLLDILRSSIPGDARGLAAYCLEWRKEDGDLAVRLSGDPDPEVRRYATFALRDLGREGSEPSA